MNSKKPTIAIVTRISRDAAYLERVLDGLLLQTGAILYWTLVIQSPLTDEHMACVTRAQTKGLIITIEKATPGISLGRLANIGVNATKTEYVTLHDDDDSLNRDFLGPALQLLIKSNFVGVACHAAIINETGPKNRLEYVLSPGKGKISRSQLLCDNKIAVNGFIFRRSAYEIAQGYPEDVSVAEDWLFYLKMLKNGDVLVFPKVCANIFIRNTVGDAPEVNNTDRAQHELMRNHIREIEGIASDPKRETILIRIIKKSTRFVDRIIYDVTGQFLPRRIPNFRYLF